MNHYLFCLNNNFGGKFQTTAFIHSTPISCSFIQRHLGDNGIHWTIENFLREARKKEFVLLKTDLNLFLYIDLGLELNWPLTKQSLPIYLREKTAVNRHSWVIFLFQWVGKICVNGYSLSSCTQIFGGKKIGQFLSFKWYSKWILSIDRAKCGDQVNVIL